MKSISSSDFGPIAVLLLTLSLVPAAIAGAPQLSPNAWQRLEQGTIAGERWDIPVGFAPEQQRFVVLGGRTSWGRYKQPRPYDVLSLDISAGKWANEFPNGKAWGPRFGDCNAPAWKDEYFHFQDVQGVTRPNWTVYGTFSLGQKYDFDPDTKCFYFFAGARTFRYHPESHVWTDLQPATNPETSLGGILLWSSMCYDREHRKFVLFGGGNIQTERGDPGTWTFTPATNSWTQLEIAHQPPQRANSRLVYDPVQKKIVLFGGDQLDQLLADTWTFDLRTQTWVESKPSRAPAPRAGHALLWLPKAQKILLLGGYTYTSTTGYVESLYKSLPLEAWTYDTFANEWQLLKWFDEKAVTPSPVRSALPTKPSHEPASRCLSAAVNNDDVVMVLSQGTWLAQIDASQVDRAGADKFGVAPGTTVRRNGPHDPAWFSHDVPPAQPEKVQAELQSLVANRFTARPTPKLPRPNMDWGSAVLAPELDLIIRFSGGHSAYSGTAPQVYHLKTDRYSIPFAPEYPLEYVYSNDQVNGEWSFHGNPWMTGHTYKSTGYDPNLRCLVFASHEYTYFFDPLQGAWSRSPQKNPYRPNFYTNTVCSTPLGAVVWADHRDGRDGLWRLNAETRTWKELPLSGTLPQKSADQHGLAFDSKRNRLLFFSNVANTAGDVKAYDMLTGQTQWLNAAGRKHARVPSRETTYLPEFDLVLLAARTQVGDRPLWLAYDCSTNVWLGLELAGDDPIGKGTIPNVFHNSIGLMHDPHRHLVFIVGQNSNVTVLKLDPKQVSVQLPD